MSAVQERISQFRKMANDDPDNELGHFSLGKALMEAGEHQQAIESFRRTLDLSPQFSKVYQLLGSCLLQLNKREEAVKTLRDGFKVAEERGDRIPQEEMARLLVQLGETVPTTKKAAGPAGDGFQCQRPGCHAGSRARKLPSPPISDDVGKRIHETVCSECWNDWVRNYSIKVINELRLDLSTERGQEAYDQYMREFLGM